MSEPDKGYVFQFDMLDTFDDLIHITVKEGMPLIAYVQFTRKPTGETVEMSLSLKRVHSLVTALTQAMDWMATDE